MKHVKINTFIAAIRLVTFLFSCSLKAMNVIQPKSPTLSMQKRQAMLSSLRKSGITPFAKPPVYKLSEEELFEEGTKNLSSCKEDEIFIHGKETLDRGICVSDEVVKLCGTLDVKVNSMPKVIPLVDFPIAVIKNTFDILKKYKKYKHRSEDVIKRQIDQIINTYSQDQLVDVINCIYYLDCPTDLQNVCFDEVKNKYKGNIKSIISNKKLNPDVQQLFLVEPATRCLTNLLQKNNIPSLKKSLRVSGPITSSVALNFDGTRIVEGIKDSQYFVVSDASGNILRKQPVHFDVRAVAMSPDGTKVVVGGKDANMQLWNVNTGNLIHNLAGHQEDIISIAFSSDGSKIVSASWSDQNNLIVWDVATGTQIANVQGIQNLDGAVAFSFDGTKIIAGYSGNSGGTIEIWDLATQNQSKKYYTPPSYYYIYSVSLNRNNTKILYVAEKIDGYAKAFLLDINTGTNIQLTKENTIMNALSGEILEILATTTGKSPNIARRASFACDDRKVIVGEFFGVHILDIDDNNNVTEEIFLHQGEFRNWLCSMAVSLDGRKAIFGYKTQSHGNYPSLVELTLWTDNDETMINQIKSRDLAETKLIFHLCSEFKKAGSVKELNKTDAEIFQHLPENMRKTLSNIFWPPKQKDWFSGWW